MSVTPITLDVLHWSGLGVGDVPADAEITCQRFDDVTHTCHLEQAVAIVGKGAFHPRLVYDASTLNKERIQVVWVSPNRWYNGYRYGSIQFAFNWDKLIAGRNIYWVETMGYSPLAPRILITSATYEDHPTLRRYDPTARDGPWWHDSATGTHYRNGNYCLEFMLEFPVGLKDATDLRWVEHAPGMCSVFPASPERCPESKSNWHHTGARFVATVVGHRLATASILPLGWTGEDGKRVAGDALETAWSGLYRRLSSLHEGGVFKGTVSRNDARCLTLAHAFLVEYGADREQEAAHMASLFDSFETALNSCAVAVETAFGLSPRCLER